MKAGIIYLLHFDTRYQHAGHYLGWTRNLSARVARHFRGHGSRLMQVVMEAGISVQVARTWEGDRNEERRLKKQGGRSRLCPVCLKEKRKVRLTPEGSVAK